MGTVLCTRPQYPSPLPVPGSAQLKQAIKQWIVGTPLEGFARSLYRSLGGAPGAAGQPPAPNAPPQAPAGVDLNTLYDAQTAEVLERVLEKNSNCVDVGCHQGAILDVMLRLSPEGLHFAFEPLPHLYAALAAKYARVAAVQLHEVALSDTPGKTSFQHVVSNPGYSGILRRQYDRPDEEIVEIPVTLAKLDDLLPPDVQIRLVKIDVEGAELQVMRGGAGMLRRCRPFVVFEHGKGAADCYGTRPEHVFDLLADCGLRVSLMRDWLDAGGAKAFTRAAFIDEFDSGRNYYFLAHA
jgi:FkbM family methyltransferase